MVQQPSQLRSIPGIIHQSWKTRNIPHDVYPQSWVESWAIAHPDWETRFWTDEDNDALVREHYACFESFYFSLEPGIKRADFCRFLYLHRFGGLYVDLDFVCLRNLRPLLDGHEIVLGRLSADNDYYQIPNALMASCQGHDFWLNLAWDALRAPPSEQSVEALSGPFRVQWGYHVYKPAACAIYGDGLIYPFDWIHFTKWSAGKYYRHDQSQLAKRLRNLPVAEMARELPQAYCVTYWTHNW